MLSHLNKWTKNSTAGIFFIFSFEISSERNVFEIKMQIIAPTEKKGYKMYKYPAKFYGEYNLYTCTVTVFLM